MLARSIKGCIFAARKTMKIEARGVLRKIFESLRPAQDQRRVSGARQGTYRRNTKEDIEAEPEIQRKQISKTIVQRRV